MGSIRVKSNQFELHTVRGLTGTIAELREAFGVQIGQSTVSMRMSRKGWDIERALLYPGPQGKRPLKLDNPTPIPDRKPTNHWEVQAALVEKEFGMPVRQVVAALLSEGYTTDEIKEATGLRLSDLDFEHTSRKVSNVLTTVRERLQRSPSREVDDWVESFSDAFLL